MRRILIIGGNGFLGKNLHKILKRLDYDVYIRSRKSDFDLMDLNDTFITLEMIRPDYIINCAAHVGSLHYVTEFAADVINDNIQMALNLYKACSNLNKPPVIINPLSNCSYPGIIDIQNEEDWYSGAVHDSVLAYATSKKTLFTISECYRKQYGIKTYNLLVANAYGVFDHADPNRVHALDGMIIRMIKAKNDGDKEFVIWGSGSPIREWIFMEDAAKVIIEIIYQDHSYGDFTIPNPINLGQEFGVSIKDSAETIKKLLNYEGELVFDTSKIDGAPIKVLGNKLFKQYFPDFKFTDYEEGIKLTLDYYNGIL